MRRELGTTGIRIRPIGLGGMPLSIRGRPPERSALKVVLAALDAGIDFIDTADVYCLDDSDIGHNERLIAKALEEWSGEVTVATKGGLERPSGAWTPNGSPAHLKRACERSLVALGIDCIDLYQLHAPDPDVPFADSVGALAELKAAGKIRHVGLSNVDVPQIRTAREIVEIVSVQNRCNVWDRRSLETGVVQFCKDNDITFLPYSPVGGSRNYKRLGKDRVLREIGEVHGADPYQVALSWLLAKSTCMVPIPGASKASSVLSSAGAMDLMLSAAEVAALDAA